MNISIFIILLFTLQIAYWAVGRVASKKIADKKDYFLAGKGVRFFPLMMTFLATQVGGGVILGAADEAYRYGPLVFLYPLGAALGLILLGSGLGRRLAGFQVSTVAQIFEVFYRSPMLKKIASILSVVSLFMILVAQIIASKMFLVSLGLTNIPLFIAFWGIVILYTAGGGLKAVISTDLVQAAFFSAVFIFCFGFAFYLNPSIASFEFSSAENLPDVSSKLTGWLLMPLLFMIIEQDMGQRCFAGSSPGVVSRAAFWAGICTMTICVIPVFFGSLANGTGLEIPRGGSVLMAVIEATTNPLVTAFVGCAVLAAIVSTATSLINAIASNVSEDFRLPEFKRIDPIRLIRVMTSAVSIGAIFFAFYFDNIVDLLIQSYELSVSCLFVSVFIALFKEKGNTPSALLSVCLGAAGFILFRLYPVDFPKEIAEVLLSFVGYAAGEFLAYRAAKSRFVSSSSEFEIDFYSKTG